ncbi:MAG: sugar phosphate isomerase/epimerase family protein [bacterium]
MKLAFSTLGCPAWSFDEIIAGAVRYGYQGLEIRGVLDTMDAYSIPEFTPSNLPVTLRKLGDAGLAINCLGASSRVVEAAAVPEKAAAVLEDAARYFALAQELGAVGVRFFGGELPADKPYDAALADGAKLLHQLGELAAAAGVLAMVETHDYFVRTDKLMELIRLADSPAVQVIWDVHHPYRMAGETVAYTAAQLDGHIRGVHVKDSLPAVEGKFEYCVLGAGDVPTFAALRALHDVGYDGYLTVEWEKRWIKHLAEPEEYFPQAAVQLRSWLTQLTPSGKII